MHTEIPDIEAFKDMYSYNPETGEFKRRKYTHGSWKKRGDIAGWMGAFGYMYIAFRKKHYMAHRVAWLFVHGKWPNCSIDHINGNRSDNRISNLRDVSPLENNQNRRKFVPNTHSGYVGVKKNGSGWLARISSSGKTFYLGTFRTRQEAHEKYVEQKKLLHTAYAGSTEELITNKALALETFYPVNAPRV